MTEKWLIIPALLIIMACDKSHDNLQIGDIYVDSLLINNVFVPDEGSINNVDIANITIRMKFTKKVDTTLFNKEKLIITGGVNDHYIHWFSTDRQNLFISPIETLEGLSSYRLFLEQGKNLGGVVAEGYAYTFHTGLDDSYKFPLISDDSLLTLVQKRTFDYFWEYGHPVSGLTRDRLGAGDVVTASGSGFGCMAIITGIEKGFITRQEGFERLSTMVNFLIHPTTSKFHGTFAHWTNGSTGEVIPFSQYDDGGDLVETAFLMQGLLTVKQYFSSGSEAELALCDSIQKLWEAVEWDWYRNGDQNNLFWHWSPNYNWQMNMTVSGWNEALMVYVLAASSPTHPVPKEVYDQGWARNGNYPMVNGTTYYDIQLPLGEAYGGPLFFAHYSFLGLDPRNLSDQYASYWGQNTAHARINYEHCKANPNHYPGYGTDCWGLTASDIPGGYSASSPTNDLGVIAPTAAIASIPYTPEESLDALRFFYYVLGNKLWGDYGFYDAFSLNDLWFASSYIAIDQGPIVCMIENYRTGLLWDLFMSNTEVQNGLAKLGFTY